jgi:hypothetical protein
MTKMINIPAIDTYKVTAYNNYGIAITSFRVVGYYRWYWSANLISWIYHNIFGYSCNTHKKKIVG